MRSSFDEDDRLCPESVVAEVVASAALDDELELPDLEPLKGPWRADAAEACADTIECEPQVDAGRPSDGDADRIGAWAMHAHAASGFGG
jgi:hypothetical protein